jgi:hypothetical protein
MVPIIYSLANGWVRDIYELFKEINLSIFAVHISHFKK